MLDDGLHSHHWRDCRIGGTVPVSGFFNTLLRGPLLPAGIGASGYHGCSPSTSTRDVGLDSRRHGGTGARSLLSRRSPIWEETDQDTAATGFLADTLHAKLCSLSQRNHRPIDRTRPPKLKIHRNLEDGIFLMPGPGCCCTKGCNGTRFRGVDITRYL